MCGQEYNTAHLVALLSHLDCAVVARSTQAGDLSGHPCKVYANYNSTPFGFALFSSTIQVKVTPFYAVLYFAVLLTSARYPESCVGVHDIQAVYLGGRLHKI